MLEDVKIDPEPREQSWGSKGVLPWTTELVYSDGLD